MELHTLSNLELRRIEIFQSIINKHMSVVDAASHLNLSRSQVHRLLSRYKSDGTAGIISRKRGMPSNRRYSMTLQNYVLGIIREHYHDFGPTFAVEKLESHHDISISKETLRKWMIGAGIWKTRKERRSRVYQPRNRRDCFGELIQVDTIIRFTPLVV